MWCLWLMFICIYLGVIQWVDFDETAYWKYLSEVVTSVVCQARLRKWWKSLCCIFLTWKVTLLILIILSVISWGLFFADNSVQTKPSLMPSWLVHCNSMVLLLHKLWTAIYFRSSYEKFERSRGGTSAEEMAAMPQRATLAWSEIWTMLNWS
jgi:hypothetical protein